MSLFLNTDVTAVKIYKNLILAGIGSYANIFNNDTSELLKREQCLYGQRIYDFVPFENADKVLVFGGKQFTILKIDAEYDKICVVKLFEPVTCDDWLHAALWVDEERISVLTAHNVVQSWTLSPSPSLTLRQACIENHILYSGLLVPLQDNILALAGTVDSEVIVHHGGEILNRLTGHKGVIFSVTCDITQGIIVTTSDDRSVCIWGPKNNISSAPNTLDFWSKTTIVCRHELYGHSSRVFRNSIINNLVISVGEDSAICFWDFSGKLHKKIMSHQNGCIWSVDADDKKIVTGGSDGAVIVHPLTLTKIHHVETVKINRPKKVCLTAKNNIIVLSENLLIHVNVERRIETRYRLNEKSSYKCMSLSSCRQMIAICDMQGQLDVFLENFRNTALLTKIAGTVLQFTNILSMHWAGNRYLVFCSLDGVINVITLTNSGPPARVCVFYLPQCKERWLTSAAYFDNLFVFGDRCGNLHIYVKGDPNPVQTFDKIHGRYGPTSMNIKNNEIITTGRDGTVKLFTLKCDRAEFTFSRDLEFQWIDKFLDKDDTVVCGFYDKDFVVYNLRSNAKMCEVPCGGGHRSWDAMQYEEKIGDKLETIIKFVYIKNNDAYVNKLVLSRIVSKNLILGTHGKEINCLKTFKIDGTLAFVTGSEDTTLRVSLFNSNKLEGNLISKHLSSIKTVKTYHLDPKKILTISGGGRAQICASIINLQENEEDMMVKTKRITDYMVKGIDKMRKNNKDWRNSTVDFNPETRIMDLDTIKTGDTFKIYAGCSDAYLRIFELDFSDLPKIQLITEIKYHKTCILKIKLIEYANKNILITCTTRGEVAFWHALSEDKEPFLEMKIHENGINSVQTYIYDDKLLVATGGDDNAIHLVLLELTQDLSLLKVLSTTVLRHHTSQVAGLLLVDKYLVSTSIDQRVNLIGWKFEKDLECAFVDQIFTNVADAHGIELVEHTSASITVCVFGSGLEILNIKLPDE